MKNNILCLGIIIAASFIPIISCSAQKTRYSPMDNKELSERFSPTKVDFSSDYVQLIETPPEGTTLYDATQDLKGFDIDTRQIFSSVGEDGNTYPQNGTLGNDYRRIQIYLSDQINRKEALIFEVKGKTRMGDSLYPITGTIKIEKILKYRPKDLLGNEDAKSENYIMYGHYHFAELPLKGAGEMNGTCCYFVKTVMNYDNHKDELSRKIVLDVDDKQGNYYNSQYIGIRTDYASGKTEKCLFGDNKIGYSFDFDIGTTEMSINPKYKSKDWENFQTGDEMQQKTIPEKRDEDTGEITEPAHTYWVYKWEWWKN